MAFNALLATFEAAGRWQEALYLSGPEDAVTSGSAHDFQLIFGRFRLVLDGFQVVSGGFRVENSCSARCRQVVCGSRRAYGPCSGPWS